MIRISICALVLFAFGFAPARATVYVVRPDGSGDFETIQQALDAAVTGDVVELASGTFTGPGNRDLQIRTNGITLRSQSGDPDLCTIYCQSAGPGLTIGFGLAGTTLSGFTVSHASSRGVVDYSDDGTRTTDCVFYRNLEGGYGTISSGVLTRCRFVENWGYFGCGFATSTSGTFASPVLEDCQFIGNVAASAGGAIGFEELNPARPPTVRNCTFIGNVAESGAAICIMAGSPLIESCTFAGNRAVRGGVISIGRDAPILDRCIIAGSPEGDAIACQAGEPVLTCCDLYGNAGGDWTACIAGQLGLNGNISSDPLFCYPEAGDYSLQRGSPCAPEQNLECGLIGAYPVGCGPVPELRTTWGAIKSMHRSQTRR